MVTIHLQNSLTSPLPKSSWKPMLVVFLFLVSNPTKSGCLFVYLRSPLASTAKYWVWVGELEVHSLCFSGYSHLYICGFSFISPFFSQKGCPRPWNSKNKEQTTIFPLKVCLKIAFPGLQVPSLCYLSHGPDNIFLIWPLASSHP